VTTYNAGQSFSELPGDRHSVSANASETLPEAPRGNTDNEPDDPIRELRFNTKKGYAVVRAIC
jgi:hypothetical protein